MNFSESLVATNYFFHQQKSFYRGKVRDVYDIDNTYLAVVACDRISAFDHVLPKPIPYKGQVLNLVSAWWFEKTKHIIPNHVLSIPDANTTIAKKCKVFPIEFVVRGYITGSTNTSLWTQYNNGVRHYCGHDFPDSLRKNQKLVEPVLTPTTKDAVHDRPISAKEIIDENKGDITRSIDLLYKLSGSLNKTLDWVDKSAVFKTDLSKLIANLIAMTSDMRKVTDKVNSPEGEKTLKLLYELLWRLEPMDSKTIRTFLQKEGIKVQMF